MEEERTELRKRRLLEYYKTELPIFKVLSIFNHYFGEDRVELHNEFLTKLEEYIEFYIDHNIIRFNDYSSYSSFFWDHSLSTLPDEEFDNSFYSLANSFIEYISKLSIITKLVIHFPDIIIKNEYNDSHNIKDLFAIFSLRINGELYSSDFELIRSTFTKEEILSDYSHSHLSGIMVNNNFDQLSGSLPCLGSGPIGRTLSTLSKGFDEGLYYLLCVELEKYVETESIGGGPYRRMTNVKGDVAYYSNFTFNNDNTDNYYTKWIPEFLEYVLSNNKLKYNYINGLYKPAYDYAGFTLTISNLYIKWVNENKITALPQVYYYPQDFLIDSFIKDNLIGEPSGRVNTNNVDEYINKPIIKFKGEKYYLKIINSNENSIRKVRLLKRGVVSKIYSYLLIALNRN